MGGAVEEIPAYLEPNAIWDDLFSGFMAPDMPREDPNRLLMNALQDDYLRVSGHRRLGANDKQLLERHMAFLADIERELGATLSAGCTAPERPVDLGTGYP